MSDTDSVVLSLEGLESDRHSVSWSRLQEDIG